jgi:hypothetical protein
MSHDNGQDAGSSSIGDSSDLNVSLNLADFNKTHGNLNLEGAKVWLTGKAAEYEKLDLDEEEMWSTAQSQLTDRYLEGQMDFRANELKPMLYQLRKVLRAKGVNIKKKKGYALSKAYEEWLLLREVTWTKEDIVDLIKENEKHLPKTFMKRALDLGVQLSQSIQDWMATVGDQANSTGLHHSPPPPPVVVRSRSPAPEITRMQLRSHRQNAEQGETLETGHIPMGPPTEEIGMQQVPSIPLPQIRDDTHYQPFPPPRRTRFNTDKGEEPGFHANPHRLPTGPPPPLPKNGYGYMPPDGHTPPWGPPTGPPTMPTNGTAYGVPQESYYSPYGDSGSTVDARQLTRMYDSISRMMHDDMKYGGTKDSLRLSLEMFEDACQRVELPSSKYMTAMVYMLKDSARLHYYTHRAGKTYDEMKTSIRDMYEGPTYAHQLTMQWKNINFQRTRAENPTKSPTECIDKMIDDIMKLQCSLPGDGNKPRELYNRLIDSMRDSKEFEMILSNPPSGTQALVHSMKTCIGTYMRFHAQGDSGNAFLTENATDSDIHMVDRRYKGTDNRPYNREQRNGRDHGQKNSDRYKNEKRCFVCRKQGCWSTKHTREERDKARKRVEDFSRRYFTEAIEDDGIEEEASNGTDQYLCDVFNQMDLDDQH